MMMISVGNIIMIESMIICVILFDCHIRISDEDVKVCVFTIWGPRDSYHPWSRILRASRAGLVARGTIEAIIILRPPIATSLCLATSSVRDVAI